MQTAQPEEVFPLRRYRATYIPEEVSADEAEAQALQGALPFVQFSAPSNARAALIANAVTGRPILSVERMEGLGMLHSALLPLVAHREALLCAEAAAPAPASICVVVWLRRPFARRASDVLVDLAQLAAPVRLAVLAACMPTASTAQLGGVWNKLVTIARAQRRRSYVLIARSVCDSGARAFDKFGLSVWTVAIEGAAPDGPAIPSGERRDEVPV